ncbi:glycosyltransferase family 4 protein [Flavobacterium xueshanense]|uniref:Glycosyltransferase involved in cell wall bisynthesis n=1 Tax=Flavobacterium xueshanense TaxID=935223 RepID=A0A1I2DJZ4_9FLAO|nr:glycosyltransferase family 4 protein [Flavobacterium xueshanense]SFE80935.1 Glycosyltransferase involved in cell wall bisynthesis [Flavobacterium xueshanense]
MKLLYIIPNINNEGGVARVLSVKTNYLIERLGYEVHILTQNEGFSPLFYSFNSTIFYHDLLLKGSFFQFFNSFSKGLKSKIKTIQPDVIIVSDNGLKAYLIPFILNINTPIIFECHSSKYIEESKVTQYFALTKIKILFKQLAARRFTKFVALSKESLKEWNVKNGVVIPNPLWFEPTTFSDLKSKKVIAVGRHTYEKGLDRMLQIWQKVIQKHSDWILEIYGKSTENGNLRLLAEDLNILNNVIFYEPVQNINEKYLDASFYLMTSRYEGFGMVLIEAMASGLPCVAYDCPCGPRGIISQNEDGFLIEDGNESDFVKAIATLIENTTLRRELGKNAKLASEKYHIDAIMATWNHLFIGIKKN